MFSKIIPLFLLVSAIQWAGCSSGKEFPSTYKGEQLHFGQGGGFTGGVLYYALFDNGQVYKRGEKDSIFTYHDRWDKTFVTQMLNNYQTLQIDSISYYEPGDIYYFIHHTKGDAPFHRITWGRNDFRPDPKVVHYYNLLFKSTNQGS